MIESGVRLSAEAECLPKVRLYTFGRKRNRKWKWIVTELKAVDCGKEAHQYACRVYRHSQSQTTATALCGLGCRSISPRLKWCTDMRANESLCLVSSSQTLWLTFGDHRKYSSHYAETESVPNVARLLSADIECLPKVLISPHSAPKPKPKIGRNLLKIDTAKPIQHLVNSDAEFSTLTSTPDPLGPTNAYCPSGRHLCEKNCKGLIPATLHFFRGSNVLTSGQSTNYENSEICSIGPTCRLEMKWTWTYHLFIFTENLSALAFLNSVYFFEFFQLFELWLNQYWNTK